MINTQNRIGSLFQVFLSLWVVIPCSVAMPSFDFVQNNVFISHYKHLVEEAVTMVGESTGLTHSPNYEIRKMLYQAMPALKSVVINKVLTTLDCAEKNHIANNDVLTIIDYSLPSSEKRLWIFNLKEKKLLFNTYVSHGIKSGALLSTSFSNKFDSKSSSIGVYSTEKVYYGRDGMSLRLNGLEKGYNDHAFNRYIVMHGGWYVEEAFIKKYGRAGRSWGCPAVPLALTKPIISTIKDNTLFVAYYPNDSWLQDSKFLTCNQVKPVNTSVPDNASVTVLKDDNDVREPILFIDANKNSKHEESEPILVVSADNYQRLFNQPVPLKRMLRRQIKNEEYVALSTAEFGQLALTQGVERRLNLQAVNFVIPVIKEDRGYYETQMHLVEMGGIKDVVTAQDMSNIDNKKGNYGLSFNVKAPVRLGISSQFIRWLGL